ncbi:MAG TPA: pilin [Candidatus Paceibacterota bacterium]
MFCRISTLLNSVLPVLVALGVVYLVWGVVQYVIGDSDEAKKKGKDKIIFGIIGLVVIVGLWGLVYIVLDTFGLGGDAAPSNLNNLLPPSRY